MRLEPEEIVAIKACAIRAFGKEVLVRLFGSRTDDSRRGGDIDLMIETTMAKEVIYGAENKFRQELTEILGERRIDIVTHHKGDPLSAIADIALTTGILL